MDLAKSMAKPRLQNSTINNSTRTKMLLNAIQENGRRGISLILIIFPKLISAISKVMLYSSLLNKKKKEIYYYRYLGMVNAIMGKSSWYRPKV